jgi:hypothetical protein
MEIQFRLDGKEVLFRLKLVFSRPADRADPTVRKVFEFGSGFNAAVRVTGRRIVHIAANSTDISFHGLSSFYVVLIKIF